MYLRVWNCTRQCEVAGRVEVARNSAARRSGLLGKQSLAPGEGLWLAPCEAIHTCFMRFAIDLIYLDRQLRVKKIRAAVPPWRFSACLSAHSVLELGPWTAHMTNTRPGDQLEFRPIDSG